MIRNIFMILLLMIIVLSCGFYVSEGFGNKDTGSKDGTNPTGNTEASSVKYSAINYDTVYHDEYPQTSTAMQGNITYYQPGSFTYGASSYVPYYEDSVFLSRSNNRAIVNAPAYVTSEANSGFCNYNKSNPDQLELKCNALNAETCAATTCCALLGGQKCVSGDANGPTMKSNYSDFSVLNKDFYYYQGKCYGNCPNSPFPTVPTVPTVPSK
jgi:hypothetical protein